MRNTKHVLRERRPSKMRQRNDFFFFFARRASQKRSLHMQARVNLCVENIFLRLSNEGSKITSRFLFFVFVFLLLIDRQTGILRPVLFLVGFLFYLNPAFASLMLPISCFLFFFFFFPPGLLFFEASREKKFSSFRLLYIYLILFYLHSTFLLIYFIHLLLYNFLNGCIAKGRSGSTQCLSQNWFCSLPLPLT